MAMDVSLPEQAQEELNDFLAQANLRGRLITEQLNTEMSMLAKGMAMQQAGIIPQEFNLEILTDKVNDQLQLEGLR